MEKQHFVFDITVPRLGSLHIQFKFSPKPTKNRPNMMNCGQLRIIADNCGQLTVDTGWLVLLSKTFRGEWDAGMAFAFQGMLRGTSRSRQQQQLADLDVEGRIKACVNAGVPEGASALTHAAWRAGCADGAEFDELQQVRRTANRD